MFSKLMFGFVALSACSAVVFAGPAVERPVEKKAVEKGASEKGEGVEGQIEKGGSPEAGKVERIKGKGKVVEGADATAEGSRLGNASKKRPSEKADASLDEVKKNALKDAQESLNKVEARVNKAKNGNEAAKFGRGSTQVLSVARIGDVLGKEAAEAVVSAKSHTLELQYFGMALVKRVKAYETSKGAKGITKEVAAKLLKDVAESPKQLDGALVIGEGASKACMEMASEAVNNFAEFIGAAADDKTVTDSEKYVDAMGKKAAEKFKQKMEEGVARICALAKSGCGLFSAAIGNACTKMAAIH